MNTENSKVQGFLKQQVSVGVMILTFFCLLVVSVLLFYNFRQKIYSYTLTIPEGVNGKQISLQYGPRATLTNANYFTQVRDQFVNNNVGFVEADLSAMRLRVYKDSKLQLEVPILTKGREGSWWETPAGIYRIESKEENHFSSFGHVNQPWSLAFQGNFFIHGWPTYPDGTPVSSSYSGGCIRLADKDAERVYSLAEIGMPVLVHEKDFLSDNFVYQQKIPEISAQEYLVADLKNNYVFLEKNSKEIVPIASVTKLVTALVSAEYINLDKKIVITDQMLATTSVQRLKANDSVTAFQLLYPLLLESSNEAAEALARSVGRNRFINLMNEKAKALGMQSTKLEDPSGAGAGNLASAEDLYALVRYLFNNRSFVLNMTAGKVNYSSYGVPTFKNLQNFNEFVGNPEFVGGKVGQTTAAKQTMVSVFEISIAGEIRPVAIIVLGSENRKIDTEKLLEYVKQNYQ